MGGDCRLLFEQSKEHTCRQESTLYKHSSFRPSVLPSLSIPTPFKALKEQGNGGRAEAHKRVYFYNRRVRSFLTRWWWWYIVVTHTLRT